MPCSFFFLFVPPALLSSFDGPRSVDGLCAPRKCRPKIWRVTLALLGPISKISCALFSACSNGPFSLPHIFPHSAPHCPASSPPIRPGLYPSPQVVQDNTDSTPLGALPVLANATLTCNSLQAPDLTDTRPKSHACRRLVYLLVLYRVLRVLDDLIKVSFFPKTLPLTFTPTPPDCGSSTANILVPTEGAGKACKDVYYGLPETSLVFFTSKAGIVGS